MQGTLHSTRQVVCPARHNKRACTHKELACAQLLEALVNYAALSMAKRRKVNLDSQRGRSLPAPRIRSFGQVQTLRKLSNTHPGLQKGGIVDGNKAHCTCASLPSALHTTGASHVFEETTLQSVHLCQIVMARLSRDLTQDAKSDTSTLLLFFFTASSNARISFSSALLTCLADIFHCVHCNRHNM